jgi:hypothetical protein
VKRLGIGLAAILAISCSSSPANPTAPIDSRVTVALGENAVLATSGASLRFDAVIEDSRCPADAMCITAGRAGVRLAITATGGENAIELRSDPASDRIASAAGLQFEWVQLDPYPLLSRPTLPGDYRLTVRVVR